MTTLPPGHYYVGDLCYLPQFQASHDEWCEMLKATNYLHSETGKFEWKGTTFFSSPTKYGDGCYTDQYGNDYSVDAGLIGCFPVPEVLRRHISGGHVHYFSEPFTCATLDHSDHEGAITVGRFDILTGDLEENEWDDGFEDEEEDNGDDSYDEDFSGNNFYG